MNQQAEMMMWECCKNRPRASNDDAILVDKPTDVTSSDKSDRPLTTATYPLMTGISITQSVISTWLCQHETLNGVVIGRPQTSVIQLQPRHLPSTPSAFEVIAVNTLYKLLTYLLATQTIN